MSCTSLRSRFGFFILLAFSWPGLLTGQDFGVIASSPAPGDSAAALETTVRFTFSAPIDTSARFAGPWPVEFFAVDPPEAISIDSVYFSADLTEIDFDVTHRDSTDFTWIMTGARDADSTLACPFVLAYTTSPDRGRFSISGRINVFFLVKGGGCEDSIVAGLRTAPYDEPGDLARADVLSSVSTGQYLIGGVRPGTYWPVAFFDSDSDGIIEPEWSTAPDIYSEATHLGLFTDDIDSVVVVDESLSEVNMAFVGGTVESDLPPTPFPSLSTYPNPFTDRAKLVFDMTITDVVTVALFDVLGRRLGVQFRGPLAAGHHEIPLDVSSFTPGAYVLRIQSRQGARSLVILLAG